MIVYVLTCNKSGVTQSLRVALFSPLKYKLINLMEDMSYFDEENNFDGLYFLVLMRSAYEHNFFNILYVLDFRRRLCTRQTIPYSCLRHVQ